MITCTFENGNIASPGLRHVTVGAIVGNDKQQVLLVRRSQNIFNGNKFSVPGGFLDRDETAAQGVLRELTEETGYVGKVVNLFRINDNPNRPKEDRQAVDFLYIVTIVGGSPKVSDETSEILWFDKKNLPADEEFAFDHRESIMKYFEYLENKFSLPIFA